MTLHQFQVLVSDRVELWNKRTPQYRVGYFFTRHGIDLYDHSVLKPDPFIRSFNYDPAFEHLSVGRPGDRYVVLKALTDILKVYFGQKENVKMPVITISGSCSSDVKLYGSEVSSYFVDDILTTDEAYNRYLDDYFISKEWKKWKNKIDRVIFNDPATIILWKSGEKTVVKCGPDGQFDKEKGLAMALCKYVLGNRGNFNEFFKAFMKEDK